MARIAIDITPNQLAKAKTLVDAGVYESLQQLGEVAFANQLALEDGADPEDLAEASRQRRSVKPRRIPPLPPSKPKAKPNIKVKAAKVVEAEVEELPSFADLRGQLALGTADVKAQAVATTIAAREPRVLGLVNKPFGLKLVARAALVKTDVVWPNAGTLGDFVNVAAASIGAEVAGEDRKAERTRNLLQTGLPTKDTAESNQRFGTQYLGRVARSGQITAGAIVQFALATIVDGKLVLSDAGVQFARLTNPVFDENTRPWERLLSAHEQEFLVRHVERFVPSEAADTKALVRTIQGGHDKPEAVLAAMKEVLPTEWSEVQTRSYVSGLVTRLTELDVIRRIWTGRYVHYELGPLARMVADAEAKEVA
jgi:hypothetical protein